MKNIKHFRIAVLSLGLLAASIGFAADSMLSKDDATKMALEAHPGELIKAYKETRRGEEVWEVQVKGDDGKKWEIYYSMAGKLVKEESE
ncbi:MAG: PepSY domain-containing protein [Gammaproteobacteria bacterium]|nr:PepSY domain-containing protein [Gammaproteobacteria bacterium]MCP5425505.1 PepSY domain-containing protein [Gammaproteobacteria bacterium]MCP5459375.1 PepSY domain-containing protein [Gammaproteobacteria bacterium]